MELFNVYPRFSIELDRGEGCYLYDREGAKYLDFYGGHGVISLGHSHPHYIKRITDQLERLAFYSNSVKMPIQDELAEKLGALSGYPDYHLFLCNSGAEATENAMKLASFSTGRKRFISFEKGFHGRTSAAVAVTDNRKIQAPMNRNLDVHFLPLNDEAALEEAVNDEVAAVIVEGVQGIGGVQIPSPTFLRHAQALCIQHGAMLILDEIQSGYGRTGEFFAHQHSDAQPDLITMAKGMGNGFPVAGVLINPHFEAKPGMLGTTFGGNPLACAAALGVLEVLEKERLMENAQKMGEYLVGKLKNLPGIQEVRALGLMVGVALEEPCAPLRKALVEEDCILTGSSSDPHTLRFLPPLSVGTEEIDLLVDKLSAKLMG